jgi:hypothetical protein
MSKRLGVSGAIGFLVSAMLSGNASAQQGAQPSIPTVPQVRTIALKSGESTELTTVYSVMNCKSTSTAPPEVEVLEGPPELTLTIRPGMVVPRNQGCTNQVSGGTVIAAAKDVQGKKTARLVYRVKYKTKDGDRQNAQIYSVELFP